MNKIYIEVIREEIVVFEGVPCARGKITIGDFDERFGIALEYWTLEDYKRQWRDGLERINTHDKSCFVTYVQDPEKSPFLNWWNLYKVGNKIIIRNQILFAHLYSNKIGDKRFTPNNCYDFLDERIMPEPDEPMPAEWIIDLE
ncbi:hypothetical protein H0X48_05785 [Candidatus Dependentiae bacterium]|nr:hypothetical protein [Tatlockia sp.]MBA3954801.1 hypothetical protein [Candidatus Dependentiae bacterium]